jgi:hypothetical protein
VIASLGIVAGHALTYWAVAPDSAERQALLASTGHAYWNAAVIVVALASAGALLSFLVRRARGAIDGLPEPAARLDFAGRLIVLQVLGFVAMEALERTAACRPVSLSMLLDRGTLLLGIVVQVAVGVLLARAIEWLGRTTHRLARLLTARSVTPRGLFPRWATCRARIHSVLWWRVCAIRGPPAMLRSSI